MSDDRHYRASCDELHHELELERLKFYRDINREREREHHEEAMNEALRKRFGYPPIYPGRRRRCGRCCR